MREKLLSLKGCSSKTRVLSFKQTAATCSSTGKTTEKCEYHLSGLVDSFSNQLDHFLSLHRPVLELLHLISLLFCQKESQKDTQVSREGSRCSKPSQ